MTDKRMFLVGMAADAIGGLLAARLTAADLPVPPGFHITRAAYRRFVAEHGLQEQILASVTRGYDRGKSSG